MNTLPSCVLQSWYYKMCSPAAKAGVRCALIAVLFCITLFAAQTVFNCISHRVAKHPDSIFCLKLADERCHGPRGNLGDQQKCTMKILLTCLSQKLSSTIYSL